MIVLDRFVFHFGTKKVVTSCVKQVVLLYRSDCMGIGLGRLNVGRLIVVVV